MNAPNTISMARLLSVPVIVWFILTERLEAAFWLFVAAAVSDAVDGILAKRFGMATKLGAYLDPIADKALLVTAFVALGYRGEIPLWLVLLVVSRDVLIVGGALVFEALTRSLTMEPLWISKVNTVTQLCVITIALFPPMFGNVPLGIVTSLYYFAALTTVLSGAAYVFIWSGRASSAENAPSLKERD